MSKIKNVSFPEFVNMGGEIIAENRTIRAILEHEPSVFVALLEFHTDMGNRLFPDMTREEVEAYAKAEKEKSGISDEHLAEVEKKAKFLSFLSDLMSM